MFQDLWSRSLAVLTRPSVETFREFQRDDVGAAFTWVSIAAAIIAVLSAALAPLQRALIQSQIESTIAQSSELQTLLSDANVDVQQINETILGLTNPVSAFFVALINGIVGFALVVAFVFLLAKIFGGQGSFGTLAFSLALFNAPISLANAVLSFVPFVGGLASLGLWVYGIILTYQSLQASMNMTSGKALTVALMPLILTIALGVCGCIAIFGLISAAFSSMG